MRCDCLLGEILLIYNEKSRAFITEFLNRVVYDYFYVVPASSSGKYHPEYALGRGGLVRHTKAAVKIADDLLSLEQYEMLNELYHDEIIASLIVHDTFKQGLKGGHTVFEHPVYAGQSIKLFAETEYPDMIPFAEKVSALVCSHMGQWNKSPKSRIMLPKPRTEVEKFVHLCDYLASRKYLKMDIAYEPQTEEQKES